MLKNAESFTCLPTNENNINMIFSMVRIILNNKLFTFPTKVLFLQSVYKKNLEYEIQLKYQIKTNTIQTTVHQTKTQLVNGHKINT